MNKKIKNLKLNDDWLFSSVFGNKNNLSLSKKFIETCVGHKIDSIEEVIGQSYESVDYESHDVKFDVKHKTQNAIYVSEMQNYLDVLIKRGEYYFSVEIIKQLKPGQSYDQLQPVYIIYICTFDYFHLNQPRYVIEPKVQGSSELKVGSNFHIILLNTTARSEDLRLNALFDFINEGKVTDNFTQRLQHAIDVEKENKESRKNKMTLEEIIKHRNEIVAQQVTEKVTEQVTEQVSEEKSLEFCKKMLEKNMDIDTIVDCTGLTKKKVLEIKNRLN